MERGCSPILLRLRELRNCTKCELYKIQKPLIDAREGYNPLSPCIFWVGLSAKIATRADEPPLSQGTNSGALLCEIDSLRPLTFAYRTNMVKCAPLDGSGKLRYPNRQEIGACLPNLALELSELKPRIVFLLGEKVTHAVGRYFSAPLRKWDGFDYFPLFVKGVSFVSVQHPSYIHISPRGSRQRYIDGVTKVISRILDGD